MKHKYTLIRVVMLLALLVTGLTVAAVPGAAQEFSATLHIYGEESTNTAAIVRVHQVYYDWAEDTVTWNTFYANTAPQYNPVPAGSFSSGTGWLSVDITALVQAWLAGSPNYGVLLEQDLTGFTRYSSSEALLNRPYVELCMDGACQMVYPEVDAYIRSMYSPGGNYNTDELWTGLFGLMEKQTLLKFDIPELPCGEGCTPGYWKNHLDAWPATGYSVADDFDSIFGANLFNPDITLLEAVNANGGGANALARHGAAALLSATHPDVDYPLTVAQVIALVQAGDKDTLEAANELGCPLD